MLGICFFTQGGEYTGEPVWEGEKGVVARIGLFGSALREDFDPEKSDLDFVVEFLEPDAPGISDRYLTLAESLETIFGKRVDLITARSIRNLVFSAEVNTSLCPLYAA